MADDDAPIEQGIEITPQSAIGHAARLLLNAEMITDLALMERLIQLADSWITIAHITAQPDE